MSKGAVVRSEQRLGDGPARTCVGCRRKAPKVELVRFVCSPEGEVSLDPTGKTPGRGAYVCPDVGCFETAVRRGRLGRALRSEIPAPERDRLAEEFGSRGVQ